jgi:hypothetical protein
VWQQESVTVCITLMLYPLPIAVAAMASKIVPVTVEEMNPMLTRLANEPVLPLNSAMKTLPFF